MVLNLEDLQLNLIIHIISTINDTVDLEFKPGVSKQTEHKL